MPAAIDARLALIMFGQMGVPPTADATVTVRIPDRDVKDAVLDASDGSSFGRGGTLRGRLILKDKKWEEYLSQLKKTQKQATTPQSTDATPLGCSVTLCSLTSSAIGFPRAVSDAGGQFSLANVFPGRYFVESRCRPEEAFVSALNLGTQVNEGMEIDVAAGVTSELSLTLDPNGGSVSGRAVDREDNSGAGFDCCPHT